MWSLNSILNLGLTKEKDLFLVEGPKKVGDRVSLITIKMF